MNERRTPEQGALSDTTRKTVEGTEGETQLVSSGTSAATPASDNGQRRRRPAIRLDDPWLGSLFRPLLITILIVCLDVSIISFFHLISPDWPTLYATALFWMGLGSALISGYTTTLLVHPSQRFRRNMAYRTAELGLLLVVARLVTWWITGTWPTIDQILIYPLDTLIDGYFFLGGFIIVISWLMSTFTTTDFLEMALQPDELLERDALSWRSGWAYDYRPQSDRGALLRRFVGRWLTGGVFLVVLTAGSQVGLGEHGFLAIIRQNIQPAVITATIVYFLDGLLLITLGRLAVLRARWQIEGTPAEENIMRNWPLYSLITMLVIGVVAALLPLGGTFRLAQVVLLAMEAVYFVFYFIFTFLMGLLLWLVSFGRAPAPVPASTPQTPQTPELPTSGIELPVWLGGAFFWALMLILLGYAAFIYLSGKGISFLWVKQLWLALRQRWFLFLDAYRMWQGPIAPETDEDKEDGGGKRRRGGLFSWLGLNRMTPSQRVRYFYLSILRLAKEQGAPRRPSETPYQYEPRLEDLVGREDANSMGEITESFVQVKYGARSVTQSELSQLERLWRRIRRSLRS